MVEDKAIRFGGVESECEVLVGHLSGNFWKSLSDIDLMLWGATLARQIHCKCVDGDRKYGRG